jgi:dTMP kinase
MLISIDGIDGCGKSTQVKRLAEAIGARAIQEISPSRWGRQFRALSAPTLAQQLALFTADRAVLAERLERASGSKTEHLVSDRSYLSGVAYQSYESFLTPEFIEEMNRAIVPQYDLQIYLHIPVDVAMARIEQRGEAKTWCEKPGLLRWASGVMGRWAQSREHVVQIDGDRSIEAVASDVMAAAQAAAVRRLGASPW